LGRTHRSYATHRDDLCRRPRPRLIKMQAPSKTINGETRYASCAIWIACRERAASLVLASERMRCNAIKESRGESNIGIRMPRGSACAPSRDLRSDCVGTTPSCDQGQVSQLRPSSVTRILVSMIILGVVLICQNVCLRFWPDIGNLQKCVPSILAGW